MTHRLTRRHFVVLVGAGAVAVASNGFVDQTRAQPTDLVVLGVKPGPVPTTNDIPTSDTTEVDTMAGASTSSAATASVSLPILVQSLNVTTGQIQTLAAPQAFPDGTPILGTDESLTGITTLADGTIVLTIVPTIGSRNEASPPRIVMLSTPPKVLSISSLKKNEQLESVVLNTTGGLLGLVMKKNGTPPATLIAIDPVTGVTRRMSKVHLPGARRVRTLAQCPDGSLFATAVEPSGDTILVQLAPTVNDVVRLSMGGVAWNNGLVSLMCSGTTGGTTHQFIAFGAPRYVTPNALYSIDASSGVMTKLQDFDVAQVTLFHA
jgi:hypothetical protein